MPEEQVAVVRRVDFDVPVRLPSAVMGTTVTSVCRLPTLRASSAAAAAPQEDHGQSNPPASLLVSVLRYLVAWIELPATRQRALSAIATANL